MHPRDLPPGMEEDVFLARLHELRDDRVLNHLLDSIEKDAIDGILDTDLGEEYDVVRRRFVAEVQALRLLRDKMNPAMYVTSKKHN